MKKLHWPLVFLLAGTAFAIEPPVRPFPTKRHTQRLDERSETMATIRWISLDGDWSAGGSWAGGVVPGVNDTAQFDGVASQVSVTSGHTSGVTGIINLIITDGYSGDIGASGSELSVNISNRLTHRGNGAIHHIAGGATFVTIDSPNTVDAATIDLSTPTGAFILVKAGRLIVPASSTNHFYVRPSSGIPAIIEAASGTTPTFSSFNNAGGTVLGSWAFGSNAVFTHVGGTTAFGDISAASGLFRMFGGSLSVGPNPTAGNTLVQLDIHNGVADFSPLMNTLTLSKLHRYGGEVIDSDFLTITADRDFTKPYPDF